jgi:hypothetical protein
VRVSSHDTELGGNGGGAERSTRVTSGIDEDAHRKKILRRKHAPSSQRLNAGSWRIRPARCAWQHAAAAAATTRMLLGRAHRSQSTEEE